MDSFSISVENSHPGYESSLSSTDHSPTRTSGYSLLSLLATDSVAYNRTNSENSCVSELTTEEEISSYPPTPSPAWLLTKSPKLDRRGLTNIGYDSVDLGDKTVEMEMMKERFSKLLLAEDMSGSGRGVCTAVAISNAITNLYASVFGNHLRLEPLHPEKKLMWRREMNCLLSVCDYMVELVPKSKHLRDGTTLEVMAGMPRSDIHINLPALRKLDTMLLEILDGFEETEFWYVEQGSMSGNSSRPGSFRRVVQPLKGKEEKWWLPVPCVPSGGLSEKSRKHLQHKRDCAKQIHKAAMSINASVLAEMEIPDTYLASLPKSGKASVGETIYRYINSADKFSPNHLLDCLNISSEHEALELADKVEASMYTWRQKACTSESKSSWELVKDFMSEVDRTDKNQVLADRAEVLLYCLKQRYPELSQTSLDTSKIQYNRDVGQAILESYSRVLEGLAFNTVAWIEDVLFVDKSTKTQDQ